MSSFFSTIINCFRMQGKIRISAFFLGSMIVVAVLAIAVTGSFWVYREYEKFILDAQELRHQFLENQKTVIRNEVDKVVDYIEYRRSKTEERLKVNLRDRVGEAHGIALNLYEVHKDSMSRSAIEYMIKEALRPIRFNNGRGYYFIVGMDGVEKLYPVAPQYEDKNLIDLKDAKNNYVIRDEIEVVKNQGQGFVKDFWRKPNAVDEMIYPKLTFVRMFHPFNWYLGTGEYLDDVEKDLKDEIIERVAHVRFGDEGYIFINTYKGIPIITDGIRVMNPRSLWELSDPNGVKVVQEERRAVNNPSGDYIYYTWNKLSKKEPAPKVSFIRGIPDWEWMIGAGVYLDQVEKVIALKKHKLQRDVQTAIMRIIIFLAVLAFFISVLVNYFTKKMKRSIDAFTSFFENAATESIIIHEEDIHFSELKKLSHTANAMIENRIKAEAENKLLQEQLQRAKKMESLGLLTGGVAHDLNNILSGVVSYPEMLLLDLPADSKLRRPLEVIHNSGIKAAAVVADLLSASQGAQGAGEVLDMNDSVKAYLVSQGHVNISEKNPDVHLEIRLAPDLLKIRCSRELLGRVLKNLVENAAESMKGTGKILVSTANRTIETTVKGYEDIPAGEYAVLRCEDSGRGIDQSDLARIFEPFFARKVLGRGGSGLGLTVVWHMVHDHGGYIDVHSSSAGTVFELYFRTVHDEEIQDENQLPLERLTGQGQRILVIDDEPHQREIACVMLRSLGYQAEAVESGEVALKWMADKGADLIILDMVLGEGAVMSGRTTYERILEIRPGQKAVIVTGFAETDDVKAAMALGAGSMVRKPYKLRTIAAAVHQELTKA